jgi:hypothetical protein
LIDLDGLECSGTLDPQLSQPAGSKNQSSFLSPMAQLLVFSHDLLLSATSFRLLRFVTGQIRQKALAVLRRTQARWISPDQQLPPKTSMSFQLVTFDIAKAPPFSALSYTWGPSVKTLDLTSRNRLRRSQPRYSATGSPTTSPNPCSTPCAI